MKGRYIVVRKSIAAAMVLTFLLFPMMPAMAKVSLLEPSSNKKICAVIVGGADVKTSDYINFVDTELNGEDNKKTKKIIVGTDIQGRYQTYWLNKGFLEEPKPAKQDLHDFVKFSGYDRVLFLFVTSPVMEKTRNQTGLFTSEEKTRASIGVKAFLVDEANIIKVIDVSKEDDSVTSELRAKRGAFRKCMKEIQSVIGPVI